MSNTHNDALVVYLKEPKDWRIVQQHGIYRIRGSIKHPPQILADGSVKTIAFYLPSIFGKNKYSIRHVAPVRKVSRAPRYLCCPEEKRNKKSTWTYYKIDVDTPQALEEPIFHYRAAKKKMNRREMILFPTTQQKLSNATELNFLFNGSDIEEKMWNALLGMNVYPEREWPVRIGKDHFYLDFAIFCKDGHICIEIDGQQHLTKTHTIADNKRMNKTNTDDWKTFRFYRKDLQDDTINDALEMIRKEIKNRKGLDTEGGLFPAAIKNLDDSAQLSLFGASQAEHLDFLEMRQRIRGRFEKE